MIKTEHELRFFVLAKILNKLSSRLLTGQIMLVPMNTRMKSRAVIEYRRYLNCLND